MFNTHKFVSLKRELSLGEIFDEELDPGSTDVSLTTQLVAVDGGNWYANWTISFILTF